MPVSAEQVAEARAGRWQIVLTPTRPVPAEWFPPLPGLDLLALASAGGQQGPILAAAGARVTVFDNSPRQLAQDRAVAERDGLALATVQGDMRDLSVFADGSFDLVVHPCSNCFVPDLDPVWREAFRVLRPGGRLLSGFANPVCFTPDPDLEKQGIVQMRFPIPYSDLSLSQEQRDAWFGPQEPISFGHSLEDQLGGQMRAGFLLQALYEDRGTGSPIHDFLPCYMATCAIKPDDANTSRRG